MDINKIAQEAAEKIGRILLDMYPQYPKCDEVKAIIQAAIDKAVEPWKQRYELALSDSQHKGELLDRAAHASEDAFVGECATGANPVWKAAHASER